MNELLHFILKLGQAAVFLIILMCLAVWWKIEQPNPPKGIGLFIHRDRAGRCEYMFRNGETGTLDTKEECPSTLQP